MRIRSCGECLGIPQKNYCFFSCVGIPLLLQLVFFLIIKIIGGTLLVFLCSLVACIIGLLGQHPLLFLPFPPQLLQQSQRLLWFGLGFEVGPLNESKPFE
ncbi:hypothetical protein KSP40_PGU007142 [Platanthera guangdongensis]|uniref:Uncharacterized protein n=1 Tax=Platanthera guangdongensis TaxID=2320717 RepID=A0ABR2LWB1_9ASPA